MIATEESKVGALCVAEVATDELGTALRQPVPRVARHSETADEQPIVSTTRGA